ncbi:MAG: hypothetical protein NWE81_01860 [Candidatus Bathyarchaeota archaeon]|nr:hypothetical protein [Candidatus Bathyarchaeota archaeon]
METGGITKLTVRFDSGWIQIHNRELKRHQFGDIESLLNTRPHSLSDAGNLWMGDLS